MADAFVLPADLNLTLTDDRFDLHHDGDVVLHQTFGRLLGTVTAAGDLTVRLPHITGTLRAGGTMRLTGKIEADTIHGRVVVLDADAIVARAISASERLVVGKAKLKVDVLLAPVIEIDPDASGRVTVLECRNEIAPNRVRGAFTLAEYGEDFGDPEAFLAERGVAPLGESPPPVEPPTTSSSGTPPEPTHLEAAFQDLSTPRPAPHRRAGPPTATLRDTSTAPSDEGLLTLTADDLTPVPDEETVAAQLDDALDRVLSVYADDLPDPVRDLQALIAARDHDGLRTRITDIWTGLLAHHQDRGIRLHHQVTHAFNVIHGLVSDT